MYLIELMDNKLGEITNFNIFVGITMFIALVSFGIVFFISKKMGSDERSASIITKMGSIGFIAYLFLNSLIINTDVQHYKQFLAMNLSISLIITSAYLVIKYRKDLK